MGGTWARPVSHHARDGSSAGFVSDTPNEFRSDFPSLLLLDSKSVFVQHGALLPRVTARARSALAPESDGGAGLTRLVLEAICGNLVTTEAELGGWTSSLSCYVGAGIAAVPGLSTGATPAWLGDVPNGGGVRIVDVFSLEKRDSPSSERLPNLQEISSCEILNI